MAKHLIAAAFWVLAAGCTTPQNGSAPFALAGTSWLRSDDADAAPHYATLNFTADAASGNGGCNSWRAPIVAGPDGALRFGPLGVTRMICPPASMQTEHNFLPALNRTRGYHLEGEELVFTSAGGAVVARFSCAHEPCPRTN